MRRLGPNAPDRLSPLREQVRHVIQTIDQHDLVNLVALTQALFHEVKFVARVEAGLRQQMNFPFRMRAPQAVGKAVFHVFDPVSGGE